MRCGGVFDKAVGVHPLINKGTDPNGRLKIFNESTVVARAGGGCMRDKSPWLVVCVIHMLLARMMLDGEGRGEREKNQDVKQL